ncbi:MAG: zinc ribbon domain-containing protein [Clostridiales Family XIII bacterium]|nr:zinc ribbon domain-containing protein [Clostridiales Family XIII bacterium]
MDKRKYAPARGRLVDYTLTGKIYCGLCGETIIGTAAKSKTGQDYWYYNCSGRRNGSGCKKSSVRKEWLEAFVTDTIKETVLTDEMIAKIAQAAEDMQRKERDKPLLKNLERQRQKNERLIGNLVGAIEENGMDEDLGKRLAERKEEREYLINRIAEENTNGEIIEKDAIMFWLEGIREGMESASGMSSALQDIFVRKVYLHDDKMTIICKIREGEDVEISKSFADSISQMESDNTVFALSPFGGPSGT